MPPISNFTESERKKRKREAARLRQQRCRARKRERNYKNSIVTMSIGSGSKSISRNTGRNSTRNTARNSTELETQTRHDAPHPTASSSSSSNIIRWTTDLGQEESNSNAPTTGSVSSSRVVVLKPTPSSFPRENHPSPKLSNSSESFMIHFNSPCSTLNFPPTYMSGSTIASTSTSNTSTSNSTTNTILPLVPSLSCLEPKKRVGIDEQERTAIHAMLSLRHSPVFNNSNNSKS